MNQIDEKFNFQLFESQKKQIKDAIEAKLKKIFKKKSKISKKYSWNPKQPALICDYTWKLEDPLKKQKF